MSFIIQIEALYSKYDVLLKDLKTKEAQLREKDSIFLFIQKPSHHLKPSARPSLLPPKNPLSFASRAEKH